MFVTFKQRNGARVSFHAFERVTIREKGPRCDVIIHGATFELDHTHDEVIAEVRIAQNEEVLRFGNNFMAYIGESRASYAVAEAPPEPTDAPPAAPARAPKRSTRKPSAN